MDKGDDEDEEARGGAGGGGGEDIAKVKDNEIERPDDAGEEEEDSLGSTAGNFRVKKSRGKEEEVDHWGRYSVARYGESDRCMNVLKEGSLHSAVRKGPLLGNWDSLVG